MNGQDARGAQDKAAERRAALLQRFQEIADEYRDDKKYNAIGKLNLADVGFGVAYHLVPLLTQEITRLQLSPGSERDARKIALTLGYWERWVLRAVANGNRVFSQEYMTGGKQAFRIGDTHYMGGDPNTDDKNAAAIILVKLSLLAPLAMPDTAPYEGTFYRLTDLGALVVEQLVAIEAQEEAGE